MFLECTLLVIITSSPVILGSSDFEKRFDELAKETTELGRRLTHLEVENEALDKRVQRLEEENEQLKSTKATLEERVEYLEAITRKNVPRTCHDLKLLGVTKSGSYLIDPDGAGLGEAPITVTCDMRPANGITLVPHNLVDVITEVDHCPDPGCHMTDIVYDAPMRQMKALMDLSSECTQEIQYNCFVAPLIENTEVMAWWNGADGEANYYWDGNHAPSEHTCSCNQDGTCINDNYSCNCDSGALEWLSDYGTLFNMTALPVTRLRFGGLVYDAQEANFAMGPLSCEGRQEFQATASCNTLRMTGHAVTGYYFVDGPEGIHHELVFCDMELESSDMDFQVGTNVKLPEFPVAFDAYNRTLTQTTADGAVLTWSNIYSNVGSAFDPTTGKFTTPFSGVYKFTLSVYLFQNPKYFGVEIRKNGSYVAIIWDYSSSDDDHGAGSVSVILILDEGDVVDTYLRPNGHIGGEYSCHFMGHLLFPL